MTLSFIEFLPEHTDACLAIFDSNLGKYFAPNERGDYSEWLAKMPIEGSPYFVVLHDNSVVGAGGVALDEDKACLTWGMVHRDLHGQGIGKYLTQKRLDVISELYPNTATHIDTSQHTEGFYQSQGFRTRLYQPNGFGPGIDKVEMVRPANCYAQQEQTPTFDTSITLEGNRLRVVPLQESDFEALYSVASDPKVWEQHPASDRYQESVFREFFSGGIKSGMAYRVELKNEDATTMPQVIGSSRYNAQDYANSSVEIGWTFLGREFWGGQYNRELKDLMLYFAFKTFKTVTFCIGVNNHRSIGAVKKLGARHNPNIVDPNRQGSVFYELTQESYVGLENYGNN